MLSDAEPPVVEATPATLTLAVRELASEAQPGGAAETATPPGLEPLTLVVSLREQKLDVYRGTGLVISSKVSSGKRGYDTKAGVFSILEKQRYHHSNLFSGAPMPWMQRLTWSGTALHAGIVPGYPASHGCVRLPFSFAPKLFQITTLGENVVVTGDRVAPKLIKHENLFQPAPRVAEDAMAFSGQDELVTGIIPAAAAAENPEQAASEVEPALQSAAAAPLRILVTRRTERDEIIDTQYLLASLGYLKPQNFSGRLGDETQTAIKAFQKANGLRETGAFSDDLAKKVHAVAGKPQPPAGHLFVRQDFRSVLDAPIAFLDPERSLGTYVFTALGFAPGSGEARWMAISLEGGDPAKVLDRIQIPADAPSGDFRAIDGRLLAHCRRHERQFGYPLGGRGFHGVGQSHTGNGRGRTAGDRSKAGDDQESQTETGQGRADYACACETKDCDEACAQRAAEARHRAPHLSPRFVRGLWAVSSMVVEQAQHFAKEGPCSGGDVVEP